MNWAEYAASVWEKRVDTGFWWGTPEGKRQLGRPSRTWMNNIKHF